jgi:AcrR family transcriptional regulator
LYNSVDRPNHNVAQVQNNVKPLIHWRISDTLISIDRPRRLVVVHATEVDTAQSILTAARARLLIDGYAGLSTRKIAQEAGVPLSQVHYHFGSKRGMVLALLEAENRRRLTRQSSMYAGDEPLSRRYERACDFLEDDLESGFVRVLQEMIAAGWSAPDIAEAARTLLGGWYELLTDVATEAADKLGGLGPFSPLEVATLIGNLFIGSEAMLLLGFDRQRLPIRSSLRRVGELIRIAEQRVAAPA